MGRPHETPTDLIRNPALLASLAVLIQICAFAQNNPLKLLVTVEQPAITAPLAARVTLHLHNFGKETLWLYRRAAPAGISAPVTVDEPSATSGTPARASGGSTLAIRVAAADPRVTSTGSGEVLDSVGLPRPKLIGVKPGDDYEEKSVVRLSPALVETTGEKRPAWGRYYFTVSYAAKYANAEELERILGVRLWHGQIESNSIELELQPPATEARGSITGTVRGSDNFPRSEVLVSLSDQEERLLDQALTDIEGKYSFASLPLGTYWITARGSNSTEDTTVFRHLVLTPASPAGTIEFLLATPETYEPKQMLHKPVLFRITDGGGNPLGNVSLEITWSSGTVLDSVKAKTGEDGVASVELIPGRNYVTVKRKGCPKEEERMDIAPGGGVDGFKIVSECTKK